jgi:hypothetical protein
MPKLIEVAIQFGVFVSGGWHARMKETEIFPIGYDTQKIGIGEEFLQSRNPSYS